MTLRGAALTGGAVLVLGLAVYLLIEVRARPAAAQAGREAGVATRDSARPAAGDEAEVAPSKRRGELPSGGRPGSEAAGGESGSDGIAGGEEEAPSRRGNRRAIGNLLRERPNPDGTPRDTPAHKLEAIMAEANKAYDRGDLDEAKAIAMKVLASAPNNPRMLRVVVSASCIAGDAGEAQQAYAKLPANDREVMKTRCSRYGVTFTD